jgi:GNAT superfamily N-acetyltransferase
MEIRPFEPEDIPDSARLFAERYAHLRAGIPELPPGWEEAQRVTGMIDQIMAAGPGLVAREGDGLRGYLGGWIIGEGAERWVYVPEWGHGAAMSGRRRTWEALYAALLPEWLDRGARVHRITLMAGDELIEALSWLSFGATTVDAMRGTDGIESDTFPVRRGSVADTDIVVALRDGLRRHLQSTPVYLVLPDPIDPEAERAKLADPAIATLLAEEDGKVTGFLRIGPSADGVATIVKDPGTASITGAFTLGDRRGAGVGSCLLNAALSWARDEGYVRVAVDFEPMNLLAARFWTATFRPVAVTMSRSIDPRAAA